MLVVCGVANAQKNVAISIDYEYELALYRPQITLASNGMHAITWESLAKLSDDEEWQVGVQVFTQSGEQVDEPIFLRDPESCVDKDVEGYRGVQNADVVFDQEGNVLVAMEPVIDVYNGHLHKRPRTILARLDRSGYVDFEESEQPCLVAMSDDVDGFESERPRLDVMPHTGEIVLVSTKEFGQSTRKRNPFKRISFKETDARSSLSKPLAGAYGFRETWPDVAVGHLVSAYTWQRCYADNGHDALSDCDVVVKFVPHASQTGKVHTSKPIKVNTGDQQGVLNYRPSISINDSGESVVVWVDYRFSELGDILAQRFDASGWPVGENKRLSDGSGEIDIANGIGPEVAIKNDGSYMAVWTQSDESGRKAYGRVVTGSDHPELPFLLDSDPSVESSHADVSSNGLHFGYTWLAESEVGTDIYYWIEGSESFIAHSLDRAARRFYFTGYPNPFSKETTLQYDLADEGHVTLIIYDLLGREVKKLIDKWQAPGSYLVNVPASELAMGYYVTKLQQGNLQFSKVLIRTP